MKFGAIVCLYHDFEYLDISLFPISKHIDKVLLIFNDKSWKGGKLDNKDAINNAKRLCEENKNFELIKGHWDNEVQLRNHGLTKLYREGFEYAFIIDGDEIYHEQQFLNLKNFALKNRKYDAFHVEWNTYWKKDYYRIHPRENYKPVVLVKTKHFLFTYIRQGITSISRENDVIFKNKKPYNGVIVPTQICICYHLSYARSDEFIQTKLKTATHAPEFMGDWYKNVWCKWKPEMQNLHPVTPEEYKIAVKEDFSRLPIQLHGFIKKEKLSNRKTSIIILNWNSCELLKRCLNLIDKNTKRNYEIVIVDNGSTKDGSVEFIKDVHNHYPYAFKTIFNEENKGFAVGVNQGIKIADKNNDICLLNVDAEVTEGWLTELYKTLMNIPDAGIVGPLGNEVPSGHQSEGYVECDTSVPNLYGYCFLIMRELFDKIGYFDEIYEIGGYEDNDYCVRAKLAGYDTYISAKSLVKHKAHQVFDLNNIDSLEYEKRNRAIYLNKFFGVLLKSAKSVDFYSVDDFAQFTRIRIK